MASRHVGQLPAVQSAVVPIRGRRWDHPANLLLSLLLAWGAAQCFVAGDGARYDGWFVLAGWALALIGWRTFVHRREPVGNPAQHLAEALHIVATTALNFAIRVAGFMILLLLVLGILVLAERFTF